jgi:hypothetical protein
VSDVCYLPEHGVFCFSEAFCKGSCTNERFFRILDLQQQALPGLSLFLHYFLAQDVHHTLFGDFTCGKGLPAALKLV